VGAAPLGSRIAHGQPGDLVLVVEIADDHVDAVAARALLGSTPATEPVGRRLDRAVALARGPLDLKPTLAPLAATDRVIVDRRVEAQVPAAQLLADGFERRANLIGGRDFVIHGYVIC
jgi:hypothetical protein